MPDVSPPPGPGATGQFDDAMLRVAEILQQHEAELAEIDRTSEASLRLWLNKVVQDVASKLGIALAKAQALLSDVMTIAGNAGRTFKRAYRDNYDKHRQIRPN